MKERQSGAVVRPLVDREQGFDVLATVWMRNRHEEEGEGEEVGVNETVVFSGKVFEGLKLRDKHVRRKVELNVPTSILCVSFSFLFLFSRLTVLIVNTRN